MKTITTPDKKMGLLGLVIWIGVAILGTSAVEAIALHRGESINSVWFILATVYVYASGYRFYSALIQHLPEPINI